MTIAISIKKDKKFDVGETFSGIPLPEGLTAVGQLKNILPKGFTLSQFALKWILMHDEVSAVIPGGKRPEQITGNTQASSLPDLSAETIRSVSRIYRTMIKPLVHQRW